MIQFHNLVNHSLPLGLIRLEHQIGGVIPDHRHVGGNYCHFQAINLVELVRLSGGGTGHARQFVVHSEVVLQGNGSVSYTLPLNLDTFLGLHRLVQSVRPATPSLKTPSKLIDNDNFAIPDHVVLVPLFLNVSGHGVLNVVHQMVIFWVIQVTNIDPLFHFFGGFRRQ